MANEILNAEEERVTTADLLRQDSQSREDGRIALFAGPETDHFRTRWHDVQGSFVDEPRRAVEQADELVASVIKRLTEIFADERSRLEKDWEKGEDVSTEDLRQALRRYRSFFDRLLSV